MKKAISITLIMAMLVCFTPTKQAAAMIVWLPPGFKAPYICDEDYTWGPLHYLLFRVVLDKIANYRGQAKEHVLEWMREHPNEWREQHAELGKYIAMILTNDAEGNHEN